MEIRATAKEIADLVAELQGQRSKLDPKLIGENEGSRDKISDCCETIVNSFRSAICGIGEEGPEA